MDSKRGNRSASTSKKYSEDCDDRDVIFEKENIFGFTPATHKKVEVVLPEENQLFWTNDPVFTIGNNLLVKRFGIGTQDFIYIKRLNGNSKPSKFKFPSSLILVLLIRMKE